MSSSLRDQLLKAGLINQKQANEAEREQHRRQRHGAVKRAQPAAPTPTPAAAVSVRTAAQAAKIAKDQALNRKQQEKADRKARHAQIKQLIEQNRLAAAEGDPPYNFVDGGKIRRILVPLARRAALGRGELVIVRHEGRYELVPAAIAARIRERDAQAVVPAADVAPPGAADAAAEDAYAGFAVPDDLIW